MGSLDWRNGSSYRRTIHDLNKTLLETGRFSDVTFLVGPQEERISSHTLILSTRSAVFETMFSESWIESAKRDENGRLVVEVPDIRAEPFKGFLTYLYSDNTDGFSSPLEILYLAQKYGVEELVKVCTAFLVMSLSMCTVVETYHAAKLFDLDDLRSAAMKFMLKNAAEFVQHPDFLNMNVAGLCEFVSSDFIQLSEVAIFKSLLKWANAECDRQMLPSSKENLRGVLDKVIPLVRFPLMTPEDYSAEVVNAGILSHEEIIQLFVFFNSKKTEIKSGLQKIQFSTIPRLITGSCVVGMWNNAKENGAPTSVGVYLGVEPCHPNCLSYTIGRLGKIHEETLDFTVSRTVQVTAIGLYGPDKAMLGKGEALQNYSVDIQLFSYPIAEGKNQRTLISRASRQVATKDDYDVHFFAPVTVAKDKLFHIRLAFKGEETKHGVTRLSNVSTTCRNEKVTFNFLGPIGTRIVHPEGRIRSVVFTIA